MANKKIDLGRKYGDDMPISPLESDPDEKHYPIAYIEGVDGLSGIPEKGIVTFEYVLRERSERTIERGGKKKKSTNVDLELKSIVDYKKKGSQDKKAKTDREEVEEVFSELDED